MSFVRTEPGADPIVVEANFDVPPSDVFAAWTKPERVMEWFGIRPGQLHGATIDLAPGGRWCFVEAATGDGIVGFEGTYLEIVVDQRLVFSWTKFTERANGERTATGESRVEITLSEIGPGTAMRIVHSALDAASAGFAIGWEGGVGNLVALLGSS